MSEQAQKPWWQTVHGLVLCGFIAIAGFFLITEHSAHLYGVLPYLFLAACPLMHLFMHHGHGGHGHGGDDHDSGHERGNRPTEPDRR